MSDDLAGFDEVYSPEDFGPQVDSFQEDQSASDFTVGPSVSSLTDEEIFGGTNQVPNVFTLGGDVGDFGLGSSPSPERFNFVNPTLANMYTQQRGATATNPYPESFFSKLFGAENVDYTNIIGGGTSENILRARQGFGLPSLVTEKPYEMGDYYIGQPTIQGVVKEVPSSGIMGLLEKVPGVSTLRTMLGRNRGLPSESERFRQAVKEAEGNQINLPSFSFPSLNLSDVGRNLVQNVIASKYNPFTPTYGRELSGDFPEGYNLVPEKRVEIADLPIPTNYIDDLPQYLNTGIASIKPTAMAEARESMIDREQLIPSKYDLEDIPEEQLGMKIVPGSADNRYKFMTSTGADLIGSNPMTPNYMNVVDYENLAKETAKLRPYEREFLAGRANRIAGAPFNLITQQDLINRQMS
jgi:hypothetical protein